MRLVSIAQEADLLQRLARLPTDLPAFMTHSPVAAVTYEHLAVRYPDLQFGLLDAQDVLIGKVQAVPMRWAGPDALPDRGWDQVLLDAFRPGVNPLSAGDWSAVSLLEAHVANELRGRGLGYELISRVREQIAELGVTHLVGPVRPNQKWREPRTPIGDYARRERKTDREPRADRVNPAASPAAGGPPRRRPGMIVTSGRRDTTRSYVRRRRPRVASQGMTAHPPLRRLVDVPPWWRSTSLRRSRS